MIQLMQFLSLVDILATTVLDRYGKPNCVDIFLANLHYISNRPPSPYFRLVSRIFH